MLRHVPIRPEARHLIREIENLEEGSTGPGGHVMGFFFGILR